MGGSLQYWERRYRDGGNSGDGSYGRLAEFKASVLNRFVADENTESVVEFGCGDGNQLSLASYPRYLGLDVSPTAVRTCSQRFSHDSHKSFLLYEPHSWSDQAEWIKADVALSLDVVYHIVEQDIYELYLKHLFAAARRFIVVYTSDSAETSPSPHVRPRQFTADVTNLFPSYKLLSVVDPPWKTGHQEYAADRTACAFYFYSKS